MRPISQTPLGIALIAAITARGPITFRDYMAIALYHPEGGYYIQSNATGNHARQGWEGDYLTSLDLHPLFGAAIGRALARHWVKREKPTSFVVLEDGAGRGLLARDVLAWANHPDEDVPSGFSAALDYWLRDMTPAGRREWRVGSDQPVAPPATPIDAVTTGQTAPPNGIDDPVIAPTPDVILSNELIDAFPVHVVMVVAGELGEIYVDVASDPSTLSERVGPPSTPELAAYLDRYGIAWRTMPDGWRAEINLDAEVWMAETADRLASHGRVITIDYGASAAELYTPARRGGTLSALHHHTISADPLALTGEQDLTAHVNFSALIAVGERHGLTSHHLATQRDFLLDLGLRDAAERLGQLHYPHAYTERHTDAGQAAYLRLASLRQRIAILLDPQGMGGFRVLSQERAE